VNQWRAQSVSGHSSGIRKARARGSRVKEGHPLLCGWNQKRSKNRGKYVPLKRQLSLCPVVIRTQLEVHIAH
jgi:hypothetical protein